jgi:ElaB/YqjD/DUF883 family membrane-anchored ribosome-binding protein
MPCARLIRTAACLLTLIGLAADDHAALPAEAQKLADKADAAVANLVKSGDAQIAKIKLQEIKDLQRVHDAAAKKDAEVAKAIQARIDEIKEGMRDAPAGGSGVAGSSGGKGSAPVLAGRGQAWQDISNGVITELEGKGTKLEYPGKTGGISVDPATGEVYMVVCTQGMWKSKDQGKTFVRVDDKHIGGRCETGAAMNWDPAGGRLACFMLDGTAGMTVDGGATWSSFGGVGRGWDFGAVDWSAKQAVDLLALHHESGGELYRSSDAGKSWTQVAKDEGYGAVGLFDPTTLIAGKNGAGIMRSVDNGKTWTAVATYAITNHVMVVMGGTGYLISKQGLVASSDKGATWSVRGAAVDATMGPLFVDQNHVVVWNGASVFESADGGATWTTLTAMPEFPHRNDLGWNPAWYISVGWDRSAGVLYASHMGSPAYRWGP